jgi:hypothetical protein
MIDALRELWKGETGVNEEKQLILPSSEGGVRRWRKWHSLVVDLKSTIVEKEIPKLVTRVLL